MSNDNNIGTISFENMKRLKARRVKVNESLLQAAELQEIVGTNDQLITEIMRQQRSRLNRQVYDLAERLHVSIYDICLQFMPQMSEPQFSHTDDGTFSYEQDIRLVNIPFESEKESGNWKDKYFCLKRRMQELINDRED